MATNESRSDPRTRTAAPHDELVEFFKSHVRAEMAHDLDAAMAGVSADAEYHCAPLFHVFGRDAIRELYVRVFKGREEWGPEGLDVIDDPVATAWGPTHCVHEFPLGHYPDHSGLVAVNHFDGLSIVSENSYLFDPQVVAFYRAHMGADFAEFPGVVAW